MKTFAFFCLFLTFTVFIQNCKDEPPPDPCKGVTPVSADFSFYEIVVSYDHDWMPDIFIETDTVYWISLVEFRPKNKNYDYYEWHIGAEVLNSKTVRRTGFPQNEHINITLIVKSKPNKECYPDDDGIDTITKTFFSLGTVANNPKIGKWFGYYNDNRADTGTVEIRYVQDKYKDYYNLFIINFPNGQIPKASLPSDGKGELGHGGATSIINEDFEYYDSKGDFHNAKLFGYIDENNYINIKLKQIDIIDKKPITIYNTFRGYKKKL